MRISDWSSDVCSSDLFGLDKLYLFLSQMRALGGKVLQQSHDVITARRSLRTARGARRAVDPTIIVHRRPPSSLRAVWVWAIPALGSSSLPQPVTPVMAEPAPIQPLSPHPQLTTAHPK